MKDNIELYSDRDLSEREQLIVDSVYFSRKELLEDISNSFLNIEFEYQKFLDDYIEFQNQSEKSTGD